MPDQKPTLEYERPKLTRHSRDRAGDIVTIVKYTIMGLPALLFGTLWLWELFSAGLILTPFALVIAIFPIVGFLMLFTAWRILRRLKCD